MDRFRNIAGEYDDTAVMDDIKAQDEQTAPGSHPRSPMTKTRSMSDGGGTPSRLSPSPRIVEASRRTSKDDTSIPTPQPVTPRRPNFSNRGFSIQMPPRDFTPPPANSYVKPAPLSPKLDHSQIYASPTNILPRRSRGLDFSRAATSLHHSTLAESSPDSSPTAGGRAMNIPSRRSHYAGPEQTSTSLWSVMGNQEKMHISSSLGSQAIGSDSSSSSDDDELMDEDMDESYVTTPQVNKIGPVLGPGSGGTFGSPAMSSLMSFQQRQRPRKQAKKKARGPLGLGFSGASLSKSPPTNSSRARRESISWQANQLHISGANSDEARAMGDVDGIGDGRNVIRRVVTRRGNLLPKTKTFARIRAALMEESTPAESEFRREAEVVKQVRDCDMELEPRMSEANVESTQPTTAPSSPTLTQQEGLNDVPEDDIMGDIAMGLSSSFKQHAIKNSKGKTFWETFSESSSTGGARTTPPPAAFLPRGSSSGISEDVAMDSPSVGGATAPHNGGNQPPSAAEITRKINSKRRRDDDFDPVSFKRRAVSPGMSVHNSPVTQSPLQRDGMSWGSRPGSNGGDKAGSSAPSEAGSTPGNLSGSSSAAGRLNSKGRVGFQGMVDTHDGLMRMSIE
ncbi:uncharacterized protein FIESC28_03184 [Fusarium coffeatum]|uniref:Uncharacterized protein n=1 Tax=Fusarium coffeatum TaxID=231269 RepID=A0A366S432_9HYPO|nr:uncharacterized protein FIESC28_03184 [Fusarium coffeatum]RBR24071.1 hypothetical protein FIESC28_03184 [Fusarium coffeatum]